MLNKERKKNTIKDKCRQITLLWGILSLLCTLFFILYSIFFYESTQNIFDTSFVFFLVSIPIPVSFFCKIKEYAFTVKTIIVQSITPDMVKKYAKAGISVLLVTDEVKKGFYPCSSIEEVEKYISKNRTILKEEEHLVQKELLSKEEYVLVEDASSYYEEMLEKRGMEDNFVRSLKFLFGSTYLFLFSECILLLSGFPVLDSLLFALFIKFFLCFCTYFVFRKMPYDTDIASRGPKKEGILFAKQELFLNFLSLFLLLIGLTLPAMFLFANGLNHQAVFTIFLVEYMYLFLFTTISLFSEKNFFANLWNILHYIPFLIFFILTIVLSVALLYVPNAVTMQVGAQNYFGSMLFAFIFTLPLEMIKFARYTSVKGGKKNGSKNHKKYKRS